MPERDPFDTLGLPPRFDLSQADIRAAHLAAIARLHPDAAGSDDQAANVNDAKALLEDPERRARALLVRLRGNSVEDDANALPDGFLVEIMGIREAMEDAGEISRFEALAESRRAAHVRRIADLFEKAADSPSPGQLTAIREELNAWRYTERMIEQLDRP